MILKVLLMVDGDPGLPGGAALKHVVLEQEKDQGAATILLQRMEEDPALDQAVCQELATQELVQVNYIISTTTTTNIMS